MFCKFVELPFFPEANLNTPDLEFIKSFIFEAILVTLLNVCRGVKTFKFTGIDLYKAGSWFDFYADADEELIDINLVRMNMF